MLWIAENPASVGNRIEEIRRVTGLSSTQTRDLVKHGLTIQLKIDISPGQMKDMAKHIFSGLCWIEWVIKF